MSLANWQSMKIVGFSKLFNADAPIKKNYTLKYGSENRPWVGGLILNDQKTFGFESPANIPLCIFDPDSTV